MRERTLDELNQLKENLKPKSIIELLFFYSILDGLDFTGVSVIVDEIERRLQHQYDSGYDDGYDAGIEYESHNN